MRKLLDAVLTISSELELPAMLRQIVESAVDLSDATYGALGVLDDSGERLSQFITVGIDDDAHRAIGDLPEGHGILGVLIVDAKPLRLPDLTEHPDSYGFPPNHPPMRSFLGVPIRLRDEVYGNLYLTDKRTGEVFTDVDEELVVGLAAAAGVAIENTRLQERLQEAALSSDRDRIARDLHDSVIQRLFATGLSLQGALGVARSDLPTAMARISSAIDDLDTTVKQIRTTIFALEERQAPDGGLRTRLLADRPGRRGSARVRAARPPRRPARHESRRPARERAARDAARGAQQRRPARASVQRGGGGRLRARRPVAGRRRRGGPGRVGSSRRQGPGQHGGPSAGARWLAGDPARPDRPAPCWSGGSRSARCDDRGRCPWRDRSR